MQNVPEVVTVPLSDAVICVVRSGSRDGVTSEAATTHRTGV